MSGFELLWVGFTPGYNFYWNGGQVADFFENCFQWRARRWMTPAEWLEPSRRRSLFRRTRLGILAGGDAFLMSVAVYLDDVVLLEPQLLTAYDEALPTFDATAGS
jgi:hypothetical protein